LAREYRGGYSLGHTRMYYLKEADIALAQERYGQAESFIEAFLATIPDESKASKEITERFDQVERDWIEERKNLQEEKKKMGALEKRDMEEYETLIDIEALKHKRVICWQVAQDNGLFHE